ncbi:Phenylacetate 2-hydroxylase [Komagataella phaffii CBS 7435]|uniref:Phenylacetate 2-hydroxylase n=2 Tax=Komagataella phaffii TaxID=460519 RepID=C4R5T2_KOMPG|nr:Hypothetical protein PAS_chr3_0864 [Komagataella phaffii GS115]AOA63578.1 GQ67_03979T0 [Komagataella phaffii]CAH2449271.1 Phenylacetate 2-hydroxylase [Komagataella phaffii CBS 7435]AOA69219.1 GQ68_03952T0 [Komagataella phaffii GS115]CAY70918.1 Hypothetical protein PAS_chr3_0864 [Komagataella phaffii GS115]CCA39285.1 Phenylacetate 2-hydroxylase [Komagataella phaffii CBS 7435]
MVWITVVFSCILVIMLWHFLSSIGLVFNQDSEIKNIPSIPGLPFFGNTFDTLSNPHLKYQEWCQRYGYDIFQVRIGTKRIVIVNSYDSIQKLWTENCSSNNSRPVLYTFHKVLSKNALYTIGTTPFGQSFKRKKKTIASHLNYKNLYGYNELIQRESDLAMYRLMKDLASNHCNETDLLKFFQYFHLQLSVYMTYGYQLDLDHSEKELADEIIEVENSIIKIRSHTSSNLQDYFPILRYINSQNKYKKANLLRERRQVYMDKFMRFTINQMEQKKFNEKRQMKCGTNMRNQQSFYDRNMDTSLVAHNLTNAKLSFSELQSICLTMVSAGLDNTALNLNYLMGQFSHPIKGPSLQTKAVNELLKCHGNDYWEAWCHSEEESNCNYIMALIHETLRYFTVLPTSLPRYTTRDIVLNNSVVIPQGTTLFMNAWNGNHDDKKFSHPMEFDPERYLDQEGKLISNEKGLFHFSFGAGARMCSGSKLALKEMYVIICKMLLLFEIGPPKAEEMLAELDPNKSNKFPTSSAIEPRKFLVALKPRNPLFYQGVSRHIQQTLLEDYKLKMQNK